MLGRRPERAASRMLVSHPKFIATGEGRGLGKAAEASRPEPAFTGGDELGAGLSPAA